MKKVVYILTGVVLTTALMVGCSKANNENAQETAQSTQSTSTDDGSTKQKNFQDIDLQGEVTNIDGNKITLKVIKVPERNQGSKQKDQVNQNGDKNVSQDSKDKGGQAPERKGNRQVEYTGETKDITISDGIKIISMNREKKDSDAKTLTISDIKVGDTLSIKYSDKDKETISQITVRKISN